MSHLKSTAARILELAHAEQWLAGERLRAQRLADVLHVSRSPINEALALLEAKGVVRREPQRGYFLCRAIQGNVGELIQQLGFVATDPLQAAYFCIAEDRLSGLLPDTLSEFFIRSKYALTSTQTQALLARMAEEGWIQKKPASGWAFSPMLTTPDSLLQSYRLRLAIEPAALLEPKFHLAPAVLARCRAAEVHLLQGGIASDYADQLHERGVRFHESLVEASGNPFFMDAVRRVNRVRRLLSYRSMQDRKRYPQHCEQHLEVLRLVEAQRNEEAATMMREHLQVTLKNLTDLRQLLKN